LPFDERGLVGLGVPADCLRIADAFELRAKFLPACGVRGIA
jgi:hypothetical protein